MNRIDTSVAKKLLHPFLGLMLLASPSIAFAHIGDFLGFGARTMGLGGAGVTGDTSGFEAYHNPASLASDSKERLTFSWGLVFVRPSFLSINHVVTQNTYVADGQVYGTVDTQYRDTFGQILGLSYKVLPDLGQFTVGLVAFLPLSQLAYMDSGQPYVPEYFLYRSGTQRPQFELGAGLKVLPGLRLGAGLHTAFGLTGNGSVFLNTKANSVSTMTFGASLKTVFSGYLGLLWSLGEAEGTGEQAQRKSQPWNLGLVYRSSASSDFTLPMTASARALGNASLDYVFTASSSLFYDPAALETGASFAAGDHRWVAQVDYQFWSGFKVPALTLRPGQDSAQMNPGSVPSYNFLNILVPRAGWEWKLNSFHTLRIGYSYRPGTLKGLSNGPGNYLDPSKHVITAGWGFHFDTFLGFPIPSQLDIALNYQQLLTQKIVKTGGNEAGDMTDLKIGAPGYNAGGRLFGGAVSLALAF